MKAKHLTPNWSWEPPAPPPLERRQCEHLVNSAELYGNAEWRENRYGNRGMIPEQCQKLARYCIDGKYYCRQHAGQLALNYILKLNEEKQ